MLKPVNQSRCRPRNQVLDVGQNRTKSNRSREKWQVGDAAFCQNTFDTCCLATVRNCFLQLHYYFSIPYSNLTLIWLWPSNVTRSRWACQLSRSKVIHFKVNVWGTSKVNSSGGKLTADKRSFCAVDRSSSWPSSAASRTADSWMRRRALGACHASDSPLSECVAPIPWKSRLGPRPRRLIKPTPPAVNPTRRSQHSQQCKDPRRHFLWLVALNTDQLIPKQNGFPGLIVEHLFVKFGDISCIGLWDIVQINKQTNRKKTFKSLPPLSAWVMKPVSTF